MHVPAPSPASGLSGLSGRPKRSDGGQDNSIRLPATAARRPPVGQAPGPVSRRPGALPPVHASLVCVALPALAVIVRTVEPAWRALGLYQGFGCHLDAPVALALDIPFVLVAAPAFQKC